MKEGKSSKKSGAVSSEQKKKLHTPPHKVVFPPHEVAIKLIELCERVSRLEGSINVIIAKESNK